MQTNMCMKKRTCSVSIGQQNFVSLFAKSWGALERALEVSKKMEMWTLVNMFDKG